MIRAPRTSYSVPPEQFFGDFKKAYDTSDGEQREIIERQVKLMCIAFMESPDFKNGKKSGVYKVCCEFYDKCSFYSQTWFHLICLAVGCIIINMITVAFLIFYMKKKNCGGMRMPARTGKSMGNKPYGKK
ncbi:unnamed protein product [Caenorhabditis brenneri]